MGGNAYVSCYEKVRMHRSGMVRVENTRKEEGKKRRKKDVWKE